MTTIEQLADHEAGHCAAALLQGLRVPAVTATPAGGAAYFTDDPRRHREALIVYLAPLIDENRAPSWPLTNPLPGDESDIATLAKRLNLDRAGYDHLVQDAYALAASREYQALRDAIAHALEQHGRLDALHLSAIKSIAGGATLQHMTVKAATTVTADRGEFTAIAAAYTVDRVRDQIIPGAFAKTIARWRQSGKRLPVHWNHGGSAADIIGSIDPATMRETSEGLRVDGRLDIDTSTVAREAWRSMKNNAMSLSFGYITTRSRKRSDGITELHELDLFEISVTPGPANPDTRIIAMKALDDDPGMARTRDRFRDEMIALLGHNDGDRLRAKSRRLEAECAPVTIATFDA